MDTLTVINERLAEYLKKTRKKSKQEECADLDISITTYIRYENGEPGSLGINMSFLDKLAKRDNISISRLVSLLENKRLPKEAEVSSAHEQIAKLLRTCPASEIKEMLETLYTRYPAPKAAGEQFSPYVGDYGKWMINFIKRLCQLPSHEIALIERQLYCLLHLKGVVNSRECNERVKVIAVEIERHLKNRDFSK